MRLARSLRRTAALAAAVALFAGCADSSSPAGPPAEPNVVGTYQLASVQGAPLPAPFYMDPIYGIESHYVSGSMTLVADGTWSRAYTVHYNGRHRDPTPYDTHYVGGGTYTVSGGAVHFSGTENTTYGGPTPVPQTDGVVDGDRVTVSLTTGPDAVFIRN